jgi:hypothetical protein
VSPRGSIGAAALDRRGELAAPSGKGEGFSFQFSAFSERDPPHLAATSPA